MTETATRNGQYSFLYALDVADKGIDVFPVGDKKPLVEGGFYAATTDPDQIGVWAETWPRAGIAIPTGLPSGIVVIDADGPEQVERLTGLFGRAPDVWTRRGAHWYFRHPRCGKVVSGRIHDGVDLKADGGYVELPPSPGKAWTDGDKLNPVSLSVLPDQIANARILGAASRDRVAEVPGAVIPYGQRNTALTSMAGSLWRAGVSQREMFAALLQANKDRCEEALDRAEVEQIAKSISRYERSHLP
jgi:hypothetical protein